jgi:hypothetical protein
MLVSYHNSVSYLVSILAIPSLLYSCEILTLKQWDERRIKRAEIKFMKCAPRYSLLDHKRTEYILGKLKMDPVEKKLALY